MGWGINNRVGKAKGMKTLGFFHRNTPKRKKNDICLICSCKAKKISDSVSTLTLSSPSLLDLYYLSLNAALAGQF